MKTMRIGVKRCCLLVMAAAVCQSARGHDNPVFDQLLGRGIDVGGAAHVTLPAPVMRDALDTAAQKAVLRSVLGEAYPLDRFLRASAVAPHVLRMEKIDESQAPARRADAYFVTYGELETISDPGFLDRLLGTGDEDDALNEDGRVLDTAELADRQILVPEASAEAEVYAHGGYTLFKRVHVTGTIHTYWSRTDDSIMAALLLDPRFADDPQFPNHWQPVARDRFGNVTMGDARAYQGVGMYLKITRLAEPAGAMFVEWHLAFSEPYDWFEGRNVLGSKLPAIVQSRVRAIRREIMRASRSAP